MCKNNLMYEHQLQIPKGAVKKYHFNHEPIILEVLQMERCIHMYICTINILIFQLEFPGFLCKQYAPLISQQNTNDVHMQATSCNQTMLWDYPPLFQI